MSNVIKVELYRFFHRKELYICLGIGFLASIWLLREDAVFFQQRLMQMADPNAKSLTYYLPSVFNKFIGIEHAELPTTILFYLFPLLVVFPYATTYAEDCQKGYIKHIATRATKTKYLLAKFIVTIFSAIFVVLTIFAFSLFFTSMFLPELTPEPCAFSFPVTFDKYLWSGIYRTYPYLYILLYSLLDALFYGAFATLALAISVLIRQRFIVLIIPTILFYCSTQFFAYVVVNWKCMPELFLRQYQPVDADLGIILTEVIVLLVVSLSSFMGVERKRNVL